MLKKGLSFNGIFIFRFSLAMVFLATVGGYFIYWELESWKAEILLGVQLFTLLLLVVSLYKNLFNPLKHIITTANRIKNGDLSNRFDQKDNIYFNIITSSFKQLLEKIQHATDFIQSIEAGNLEAEYRLVEGENTADGTSLAGSLLSMRNRMVQIEKESRERNWATEGLARFVDILRTDNADLIQLSDKILAGLVKYMQANQGGLFILNNEESGQEELELIACYAYDRKKFLEKKILPGQGLIGQAYLEKETIYLTQVPQNYIHITSGLGEATPGCLVLVPLKVNNQVYGIIELASFKPYEKYQLEFIEKLGESIASTVSNAKNAKKTQLLLSESQQQTEEMRAQEEEMRQNMEELHAIQEQQERLQHELKEKVQELEQAQIEMDSIKKIEEERANAQIANRNKLMERAMAKFKQREAELMEQIRLKDEELATYTKY